jgi:hypothetical protein
MFRFLCIVGALLCASSVYNVSAQTTDRTETTNQIELLHAKVESLVKRIKEKEKELLAPSLEDERAFAGFLAQPDTGLIRLFPRGTQELTIRGSGAYYSFARLTHEYGHGSDIQLQSEHFSVGFAGADFGFLVSLGDMPLENVNLETEGVRSLAAYIAPSETAKAREAYAQSAFGFEMEGRAYKKEVPALVNATYALRSIVYEASDVLVAFRVVRKDTDGSLVLLWKKLRDYPKPPLKTKREPVTDQ